MSHSPKRFNCRRWGGSLDQETSNLLTQTKLAGYLSLAGVTPSDPALSVQTTWEASILNRQINPKKPKKIPYYSLAGNADVNGDDRIDLNEVRGFLAIPDDPRLQQGVLWVANGIHRILSRTQRLLYRTEERTVQDARGNQVQQTFTVIEAVPATPPVQNDLTSGVWSVHCTACGFRPVTSPFYPQGSEGIYPLNHSTLKSFPIIDIILEKIRADFPLKTFGARP